MYTNKIFFFNLFILLLTFSQYYHRPVNKYMQYDITFSFYVDAIILIKYEFNTIQEESILVCSLHICCFIFYQINRDYLLFEVNTKYISLSVLKTSEFS